MDLPIEPKISQFVAKQFPSFYEQEGPVFIAFVRAFYEWLESEGQAIYHARRMKQYTDIDETLEAFLVHFQKKYLYGIPFNVIINKRFLLKHVLDAYRSKGSVLCYKLLFRLIYNQDADIYLPGVDLLRASDGTWKEPLYLEIADPNGIAPSLVGATIYGVSTGTTAVVESFMKEPINEALITTIFISNMAPRGGSFQAGEKICLLESRNDDDIAEILSEAPTIIGSITDLEIINGGQDFSPGDVLAVADQDLETGEVIASGIGAKVRVTGTSRGQGQLGFTIAKPGAGLSSNAMTFLYNANTDTTGQGASFEVGDISYGVEVTYNTDLVSDYLDVMLNATSFGFPGNTSANSTTPLGDFLTWETGIFGSLATLDEIRTGNSYSAPPTTFVRDVFLSKSKAGNVTYTTASANVSGNGTSFDTLFANNDCICLQANGSTTSREYSMIKQVVNATHMVLHGKPTLNSTANALFYQAVSIFPSNFAPYDEEMYSADGSINGLNANVVAYPSVGNSIVSTVKPLDSGRGYVPGELLKLYKSDVIDITGINNGGTGYANNDPIYFYGGDPAKMASGYVATNANGTIVSTVLEDSGCGYRDIPTVQVKSRAGTGADLAIEIEPLSSATEVIGRAIKGGVGRQRGRFTTTNGFLNSDKYLQDSYYYQDFSYEIQVATQLSKYRDILYDTFHIAGTEMFGKYLLKGTVESQMTVLHADTAPTVT